MHCFQCSATNHEAASSPGGSHGHKPFHQSRNGPCSQAGMKPVSPEELTSQMALWLQHIYIHEYRYIYVYICFSSSKNCCTKTCRKKPRFPRFLVPCPIPSSRLLLFDELPPVPPLPLNVDHMQLGHNEKWQQCNKDVAYG